MKSWLRLVLGGLLSLVTGAVLFIYTFWGMHGIHTALRNGAYFFVPVATDSPRLSPAMRLALANSQAATPGALKWTTISPGFEVADLPALVNGEEVDHLYLARIDPDRFRFEIRNHSDGDWDVDQWVTNLGAKLVVNGSYFSAYGTPATPTVSQGKPMGPVDYNATAGAFVSSPVSTGICNLAQVDWRTAFQGAENAMVSYPLLVRDGVHGQVHSSRWLANRSFIGQDNTGRVVIGTTTDAFFTLDHLAQFLVDAPLQLKMALNLDGGPVACQKISLNGYERKTYGRYELQAEGDHARLLTNCFGTAGMPVVLAVFPR